jgi:hypothetical protein
MTGTGVGEVADSAWELGTAGEGATARCVKALFWNDAIGMKTVRMRQEVAASFFIDSMPHQVRFYCRREVTGK